MLDGYGRCFESEIMQKKLRTICVGIRQAFDLEDAAGPFLWEQYLAQPLNLK